MDFSAINQYNPANNVYLRIKDGQLVTYDLQRKNRIGRFVAKIGMYLGLSSASFGKVITFLATYPQTLNNLDDAHRAILDHNLKSYHNHRRKKRVVSIQNIFQVLHPNEKPKKIPDSFLKTTNLAKDISAKNLVASWIDDKKIPNVPYALTDKLQKQFLPPLDALPPPPAEGVHIGIPNVGNTCWLNSFLKLAAIGTFFDRFLTQELKDPYRLQERQLFQAAFRGIVTALRTQTEETVLSSYHMQCFVEILKQTLPEFKNGIGSFQDASEMIVCVSRALECDKFAQNDPSIYWKGVKTKTPSSDFWMNTAIQYIRSSHIFKNVSKPSNRQKRRRGTENQTTPLYEKYIKLTTATKKQNQCFTELFEEYKKTDPAFSDITNLETTRQFLISLYKQLAGKQSIPNALKNWTISDPSPPQPIPKHEEAAIATITPHFSFLDDATQKIDIAEALQQREEIELRVANRNHPEKFWRTQQFTHLPPTMLLYINRKVMTPESEALAKKLQKKGTHFSYEALAQVVTNPIDLDEEGCLSLPITTKSTTQMVRYRVVAATINLSEAHYICEENRDMHRVEHNDSSVFEVSPAHSRLAMGNVFCLEKVVEDPAPTSQSA